MSDKFTEKLNSTYQSGCYYTDASNLPEHILSQLLDSNISYNADFTGGHETYLELTTEIEGVKYKLVYTVEYLENFIWGECIPHIESEMISRAECFLTDGLCNDIYIYEL